MTSRLSLTLSIVCLMGSALPVAAQTGPREESNSAIIRASESTRRATAPSWRPAKHCRSPCLRPTGRDSSGLGSSWRIRSVRPTRKRPLCRRTSRSRSPKDISPGSYTVSAWAGLAGRAGGDGELVGAGIEVDIERREMPRAIRLGREEGSTTPAALLRKRKGQTRDIELLGDFGNGDVVDVTESSRVTFESSDTAVATVDKTGTITAVGPGHSAVVAWYGPRDKGIKASIPVEVR